MQRPMYYYNTILNPFIRKVFKNASFSKLVTGKRCISQSCSRHFPKGKTLLNGSSIHYEVKGSGKHIIFCIPGSLGSTETDFEPVMNELIENGHEHFTCVGWDPLGYGRSWPPVRDFSGNVVMKDATDAANLLQSLGFERYSILGWSGGGNTAIAMASNFPDRVKNLVIWGTKSLLDEHTFNINASVRDVTKWSGKRKEDLISMYGMDYLKSISEQWCDYIMNKCSKNEYLGGNSNDDLKRISCPTLILHGMQDTLCHLHHAEHLKSHIHNSRILCLPEGKHNLHLKMPKEFVAIVQRFLLHSETE